MDINRVILFVVGTFLTSFSLSYLFFRARSRRKYNSLREDLDADIVRLKDLNEESEGILERLEIYPQELQSIFDKARPLREELAEVVEMAQRHFELGDTRNAESHRRRCIVLLEQLEAMTRDATEVQKQWEKDDRRFKEISAEVKDMPDYEL